MVRVSQKPDLNSMTDSTLNPQVNILLDVKALVTDGIIVTGGSIKAKATNINNITLN